MADYPTHVIAARQAAERAFHHFVAYEQAIRERDRHVAFAWVLRPGGCTWDVLVDEVCRGLADRARFGISTARGAWRAFRDEVTRATMPTEDDVA